MRKPIIAGNWKMNNTIAQGLELVEEIKSTRLNENVEAVLCVPFTFLSEAKKALAGSNIKLGAQNMYFEERGAYTGEVSPLMLKELGVDYVILGHSERREVFGETDQLINKKVLSALGHGLNPIVCVGESLEDREANRQVELVTRQVEEALVGVEVQDLDQLVIAYEPIWAIGTGKTASADDANSMLLEIRNKLAQLYGKEAAETIRLQYGGSVKPETIEELMNKEHVDGALVGGASLKAKDFTELVNF